MKSQQKKCSNCGRTMNTFNESIKTKNLVDKLKELLLKNQQCTDCMKNREKNVLGKSPSPKSSLNDELVEGIDFYINEDNLFVFSSSYLTKRGYCCKNGCQNCPYGFDKLK